ncbi:uncharacterized protein V1513DRAFT_447376 [Lipomyces chichibuensis]|uniref:uncharacterized protein n=1 Tax=Lipomyces chichibuensis TaxID=1546026 RepID=UPI00334330CD
MASDMLYYSSFFLFLAYIIMMVDSSDAFLDPVDRNRTVTAITTFDNFMSASPLDFELRLWQMFDSQDIAITKARASGRVDIGTDSMLENEGLLLFNEVQHIDGNFNIMRIFGNNTSTFTTRSLRRRLALARFQFFTSSYALGREFVQYISTERPYRLQMPVGMHSLGWEISRNVFCVIKIYYDNSFTDLNYASGLLISDGYRNIDFESVYIKCREEDPKKKSFEDIQVDEVVELL